MFKAVTNRIRILKLTFCPEPTLDLLFSSAVEALEIVTKASLSGVHLSCSARRRGLTCFRLMTRMSARKFKVLLNFNFFLLNSFFKIYFIISDLSV